MGLFGSRRSEDFRNPPKTKWDAIINTIHGGFAEVRPHFFTYCIKCVKQFPNESLIRNETVSRDVDLAITVCQLHLGRLLIASKEYVRRVDGSEFVTMMFRKATTYGEFTLLDFYEKRYFKDDEDGIKSLVFCADVAKHITGGEEPPMAIMTMVGSAVEWLRLFSFMAVADAFGDNATAKQAEACLAERQK